jgi:hypothetical protein
MFIPLIAGIIVILGIITYMSTSSIVTDASAVKIKFEKVKYIYPIEKVLVDSVENLCQKDPATCKSKNSAGVISITLNDLNGYLPTSFDNSNLNGGAFTAIQIVDNNSTIRIYQTIPDDSGRKIYLNHYAGRQYGIPPKCEAGLETDTPPCSTDVVMHDFASSLETRAALE